MTTVEALHSSSSHHDSRFQERPTDRGGLLGACEVMTARVGRTSIPQSHFDDGDEFCFAILHVFVPLLGGHRVISVRVVVVHRADSSTFKTSAESFASVFRLLCFAESNCRSRQRIAWETHRIVKPRTKQPRSPVPHDLRSIDLRVLTSLFDLTPDVAFFVKDVEGRYVAVNESLAARHGLNQTNDAIGKRPQDICPGDFGRIPTEQDQRVLRTGKPIINHLELQWHRPSEPVWCLTSKLPLRDNGGQLIGLIGFSRDVRASVEPDAIPNELATALAEFEQDLSRACSPATLAARSHLSATRLARLTRKLFDLTPSQLISKTRITAASRLLQETSKTVAEIANACGYFDQSAFTRAFRTTTGLTPNEYRRREQPRV